LYEALDDPDAEPTKNQAHISVVRPEEARKIRPRFGQKFRYQIGPLKEIELHAEQNPDYDKVWVVSVVSPELNDFRRRHGLGRPKYPFHITVAYRRRRKDGMVPAGGENIGGHPKDLSAMVSNLGQTGGVVSTQPSVA
jgi:hypothetical protein